MTKDTMPQKGKYGIYVPYALLLVDFIVLNALVLAVGLFNPELSQHTMRVLLVVANTAYLPVCRFALPLRRARTVNMERLVVKAMQMVVLHAVIFFTLVTFLGLDDVDWHVYVEFYGGFFVALPLSWIITRLAVKGLRKRGRNYFNVIIIGHGEHANRIITELQRDPGYGYHINGYFDVEHNGNYGNGKYLGTIDHDLPDYLKTHHIDEIYFTLDGNNESQLSAVVRMADDNMAQFYYVPRIARSVARTFYLSHIGSIPVLAAHNNPLDNPINRVVKRAFDIVVSGLFLSISPVIFIPIAVAIKLSSPGPIFFKQKRTGYKGNEFTCLKFRTMKVNAAADTRQATKDDPRKTRVGNFLRRTSLDELPQFVNVLVGDMSIVGPRPHMVKQTADYSRIIDRYMLRHLVKPGITGWAQVTGYRGATKELWQMEGRVERDVWYIENWSLLLDIKIMVRTVTNAITGEPNAY